MHFIFTYKRLLLFLLVLLTGGLAVPAHAQVSYGHEWINFNQPYYKVMVTRNGLFRMDHQYLAAAGLTDANPRNLQLFRRGKEVAIYVHGEADGRLDAGDYVEFFGEK